MSRICPHCNYARRADDTAPDWQCPSCEKAYAKAASSTLPPTGYVEYRAGARSERRGTGRWLITLALAGGLFWLLRSALPGLPGAPVADASAAQPDVVLYATAWCGYCKLTREYFAANGIRYTEFDIETNSVAQATHAKLGGRGVPLIVIGDQVIKGYDEGALRTLLKPWAKG